MQDMFDNASFSVKARFVHYGMMQHRFQGEWGYLWRVVVVVKFCPSQANIAYQRGLHENQVDVAFHITKKNFLVLFLWLTKLYRSYA